MKRNSLRISCPDETPSYLSVELNGRTVEHLVALKVEVPSGRNTPLLKARLEFYTSLDANIGYQNARLAGRTMVLSHPPLKLKTPSCRKGKSPRTSQVDSSQP